MNLNTSRKMNLNLQINVLLIVLERWRVLETPVCGSGPSSAWAVLHLGDCPDVHMGQA